MKIGCTARVKNATKQRKMSVTSTSTTAISRSGRTEPIGVANLSVAWWSARTSAMQRNTSPNHQPVGKRLTKVCASVDGMESIYAEALYSDPGAALDDLREAVNTLEDKERAARRILGGTHPLAVDFGRHLQKSRAALRARETPPSPPPAGSV